MGNSAHLPEPPDSIADPSAQRQYDLIANRIRLRSPWEMVIEGLDNGLDPRLGLHLSDRPLVSAVRLFGGAVLIEIQEFFYLVNFGPGSRALRYEVWAVRASDRQLSHFRVRASAPAFPGGTSGSDSFGTLSFNRPEILPDPALQEGLDEIHLARQGAAIGQLGWQWREKVKTFLLRLDQDSFKLSSSCLPLVAPRHSVAVLLYNFLNGTLPGIDDVQKARLYSRQAISRWPALGCFAFPGAREHLRGSDAWAEASVQKGLVAALAGICNGKDPASALSVPVGCPQKTLRQLEGLPRDTVDGFLAIGPSAVTAALKAVAGLQKSQRPSGYMESSLFTTLARFGFLEASQRGNDGWRDWGVDLGWSANAILHLADYRAWLEVLIQVVADDQAGVLSRVRQLGLPRWSQASNAWHSGYYVWFATLDQILGTTGPIPQAQEWDLLLQAEGAHQVLPQGWRMQEMASTAALNKLAALQHHCVATYAGSCRSNQCRILFLVGPSNEQATVEVRLRGHFRVEQCRGPYNAGPSAKTQKVVSSLLLAMNNALDEGHAKAAWLLNPSALALMGHPTPPPEVDYAGFLRLLEVMNRIGGDQFEVAISEFLPFSFKCADYLTAIQRLIDASALF